MIHKGIQLCKEDILHGFLNLVETLLRLKPISLQLPFSPGQPYLVILTSTEIVQELQWFFEIPKDVLTTSAFLDAELAAIEVLVGDELQLVLKFNGSVG